LSEVISVRIRRQVKQEAARLGIDVRNTVEDALEKAIQEKREKMVRLAIEEVKREMSGTSEEE